MTPRTVLIAGDGWQRGTLSATRLLGAAGHRVVVASTERGHAAASRHAHAWAETPPVGPLLAHRIEEIVTEHGVDVVFVGDDEHLLQLSVGRDHLGDAAFPYPPHEAVLDAMDKLRLYRLAREAGVAVPEFSIVPPAADDHREWVVKPTLYAGADHEVHDAEDLPEHADDGERIFQEAVGGRLAAVVAFRDDHGDLRYLGGQLSRRTYPEPHGVSVRADIVEVPPQTAKQVELLLERIGWFGVAELQFLAAPGHPWQLIDLNGRFFGSLALTAAVGADLPSAWLAMALGEPVTLPPAPQRAASYQWLEGDLRRAVRRPDRLREVAGSLRFAIGARHSLWQADDPAPATRHAARLARSAARKAVRR